MKRIVKLSFVLLLVVILSGCKKQVVTKCTLNNDEKPENANAHIWNYVKVNGTWYHIDATWNDNASDNTEYMH